LELTISLPHGEERVALAGTAERNFKIIRESLGVNLWARNGTVRISGDSAAVGRAAQILEYLSEAAKRKRPMTREQLLDKIASLNHLPGNGRDAGNDAFPPPTLDDAEAADGEVDVYRHARPVKAKTAGQKRYLRAILEHDLTLCSGPAGSGKTYLAVAAAVHMLKRGMVRKLILARPAVEAGEKLGFLPGTMEDKVNPYLRPLLDALHDMMDFDQVQRLMACDVIEIVPLAFMRGRTLNDAMVLLDEAQNATKTQMLMFLTRMGHGSKMVITGDTSQIDLEDPRESGLIDAVRRLHRVKGVALLTLDQQDIVRHNLVQWIVEAYGRQPENPTTSKVRRERGIGRPTHLGDDSLRPQMPREEHPRNSSERTDLDKELLG
jgi:phosphate starvation-inducible PhoH-like protein